MFLIVAASLRGNAAFGKPFPETPAPPCAFYLPDMKNPYILHAFFIQRGDHAKNTMHLCAAFPNCAPCAFP
jgi:hypothetical protein